MKSRGRPPKNTGPPRYLNRLRELRQRLGMSQQEVAVQAGISAASYGALERGDKRINADTAQRLHAPLRCGVSDLLDGTRGVSVPLRFAIAAAEADGRPDDFDLPEPHEMLPLRRARCFFCARSRGCTSCCTPAPEWWPGSYSIRKDSAGRMKSFMAFST